MRIFTAPAIFFFHCDWPVAQQAIQRICNPKKELQVPFIHLMNVCYFEKSVSFQVL